MPRIIKHNDAGATSCAAFQREALEECVPDLVLVEGQTEPELSPEEQAQKILAEARETAEQKIREGYEEGYQRGQDAAQQAFVEETGGALQALKHAAQTMSQARSEFLTQLEEQLVALTEAVAARVLHREANTSTEVVRKAAASALEHLAKNEHTVLRLNPRDIEALQAAGMSILDETKDFEHVEVQLDDSVEPGGCVAETDTLRVDATLTTQLHRIIDAMME